MRNVSTRSEADQSKQAGRWIAAATIFCSSARSAGLLVVRPDAQQSQDDQRQPFKMFLCLFGDHRIVPTYPRNRLPEIRSSHSPLCVAVRPCKEIMPPVKDSLPVQEYLVKVFAFAQRH
jgi:hypothetical protein